MEQEGGLAPFSQRLALEPLGKEWVQLDHLSLPSLLEGGGSLLALGQDSASSSPCSGPPSSPPSRSQCPARRAPRSHPPNPHREQARWVRGSHPSQPLIP